MIQSSDLVSFLKCSSLASDHFREFLVFPVVEKLPTPTKRTRNCVKTLSR